MAGVVRGGARQGGSPIEDGMMPAQPKPKPLLSLLMRRQPAPRGRMRGEGGGVPVISLFLFGLIRNSPDRAL